MYESFENLSQLNASLNFNIGPVNANIKKIIAMHINKLKSD